jgi:hypothetical protein
LAAHFFSELHKILSHLLLIMKKFLIPSMLVSVAMFCSCQKQDSTADQELAQRKTGLDARENALDERMNVLDGKVKALDERVKVLAEKQKAMANTGTSFNGGHGETPNPAQEQAERERIQQFSTQMRARMADPQRMKAAKAEKERLSQERRAQSQRAIEPLQSQKQRKWEMSSGAVFPAPEATSPTPSPAVEDNSSSPSPTP